jgi:cytochrome b pre-mRNA-processing protein 6
MCHWLPVHSIALTRQYRIATEALSKFPKQDLRPDYQIQDVLRKTIDRRFENYKPSMEAEEMFRARSLQMLQENRFMDKVRPVTWTVLEPRLITARNSTS